MQARRLMAVALVPALASVATAQVRGDAKNILGTCTELLTTTEKLAVAIGELQDRVKNRACVPGMWEDSDTGVCGLSGCTNDRYIEYNATATTDDGCEQSPSGCCRVLKCYNDKSCLPAGAVQTLNPQNLDGKPGDCTDDSFGYLQEATNRTCSQFDMHANMFGTWAHGQSVHALACKTGLGRRNVCNRQTINRLPATPAKPDQCSACHKIFGCQSYVSTFMTLLDQSGQRDCFDKNMLLLRDTKTHKSEKGWDHPPPNNFWYKYYNTCQKALSLKLYTCSTIIKGKYKLSDYCPVTCKSCGKREIVKKGGAYEYQYDYEYVLPDNFDPAKRTMADVCSVKCKQCEGA